MQRLTGDGKPLDVPWFTHDRIAHGATLHFEMGDTPSDWGTGGQ